MRHALLTRRYASGAMTLLLITAACAPPAPAAPTSAPATKAAPAATAAPAPTAAKPAAAPTAAPAAPTAAPAAPTAAKPAAAPTAAKPAPAAGSATPKRGGTLVLTGALGADPPGLDYARFFSHTIGTLWNVASCKLVQWNERPDRGDAPVEQVQPDLATRWEVSPDSKTYTFHLRQGVQLPNGREVVADDVRWSFERWAAVGGRLPQIIPSMYTNGKPNVETPDKYTVVIQLNKPDADFLSLMGSHQWTLFFKDLLSPTADGWGEVSSVANIRGCGPFFPTQFVPASHITLERNPSYYDRELPYLDKIDLRLIYEPIAIASALRAKQVDAVGDWVTIPLPIAKELEQVSHLSVSWGPAKAFFQWYFDVQNPPFNNAAARRAVALAIDKDAIIDKLYLGQGGTTGMLLPSLTFWHLTPKAMGEDGKYYTTYDPREAKRLLAEAGVGTGLSFDIEPNTSAGHKGMTSVLEGIQAMLAEVGVEMKIKPLDVGAWGQSPGPVGGAKMVNIGRPDVESFVYSSVHPDYYASGGKFPFKGLPERDAEFKRAVDLMERQRATLDLAERKKLLQELQRIWARNLWMLYLPAADSPLIVARDVRGYSPPGGWNAGNWKYVWLDR